MTHTFAPKPDAPTPTSKRADPRFLDPLILEYIDGHNWRVVHEFDYVSEVLALGLYEEDRAVHVPAGFETDFASIPKYLWNILPPTGQYGKAAVVHDYLYRTPGQATREHADAVFLEAMKALGTPATTRYAMYYAVRLFGGKAYKGGL